MPPEDTLKLCKYINWLFFVFAIDLGSRKLRYIFLVNFIDWEKGSSINYFTTVTKSGRVLEILWREYVSFVTKKRGIWEGGGVK